MVCYRRACRRGRSIGQRRTLPKRAERSRRGSGGKGRDGCLRRPAAQSAAATTDRRTAVRGAQLGAARTARSAVTAAEAPCRSFPSGSRPAGGIRRRGEPLPRSRRPISFRSGSASCSRVSGSTALHGDRLDVTFVAGGQRLSMLLSSLTGAGDGAAAASGPSDSGTLLSAKSAVAERPGSGAAAAPSRAKRRPQLLPGRCGGRAFLPRRRPPADDRVLKPRRSEKRPRTVRCRRIPRPCVRRDWGWILRSSQRLGTEAASSRKLGL